MLLAKSMGKLDFDPDEWEFLISKENEADGERPKNQFPWLPDANWNLIQKITHLKTFKVT